MTYSPAPTGTPRRIKEMRPDEVAAAITADPRLIIPVGTCEQHGRHLPLALRHDHRRAPGRRPVGRVRRLRRAHARVRCQRRHRARLSRQRVAPQEDAAPDAQRPARHLGSPPGCWSSSCSPRTSTIRTRRRSPRSSRRGAGPGRRRVRDRLPRPARGPVRADAWRRGRYLIVAVPRAAPREAWIWREDYMMSREELRRYRRGWLKVPRGARARSDGRRSQRPRRARRSMRTSARRSAPGSSCTRAGPD